MDENSDYAAVQEVLESSFGDHKIKTDNQNENQSRQQSDFIETSNFQQDAAQPENVNCDSTHTDVLTDQMPDHDKNCDEKATDHKSEENSESTNIDEQSLDNKQNSDDEAETNKTTSSSSINVVDENNDDKIDHDHDENIIQHVEKPELIDQNNQQISKTDVDELCTNMSSIEQVNNDEQNKQESSVEISHNETDSNSEGLTHEKTIKTEANEINEKPQIEPIESNEIDEKSQIESMNQETELLLTFQPPNIEANEVNKIDVGHYNVENNTKDVVDVCSENVGPNNELKVDNENIELVNNKQGKQTCSEQQQQRQQHDLQHQENSVTETFEPSQISETMTDAELTITNGISEAQNGSEVAQGEEFMNGALSQDSPNDTPVIENQEPESKSMTDTKQDVTSPPKQAEMNGIESATSDGKTSRPETPISKRGSQDRASITSATSKGDPTQPENNETIAPPPPNSPENKEERRPSDVASPVMQNGDVAGTHDDKPVEKADVQEPVETQRKTSQSSIKSGTTTAEAAPVPEPERKTSTSSATNDKKDPNSRRNSNVSETARVATPVEEHKASITEATDEPKPTFSEPPVEPKPTTTITEIEDGDQTESSTSGQIEIREKSDSVTSGDKDVEVNGESSDSSNGGVGQPRATSALSGVGELSVINEGDEKTSQSYEKCDKAEVPAHLNADGTEAIQTPTEEVIVNNPIVSPVTATPEQPQTSSSNPPKQTTVEENGNSPNGERGPTPGASPEHDANNKDTATADENSPTSAFERSITNERHNSTRWWQVTKKGSTTTTSGATGGDKIDPSCCSIL